MKNKQPVSYMLSLSICSLDGNQTVTANTQLL